MILKLYQSPALSPRLTEEKLVSLQKVSPAVSGLDTEHCFYIESDVDFITSELVKLWWILSPTFKSELLKEQSHLKEGKVNSSDLLIEIGPRLTHSTPFSTNAVSIFHNVGLKHITRVEVSTRYLLHGGKNIGAGDENLEEKLCAVLHDRMTECKYKNPIKSFSTEKFPEAWYEVDVLHEGKTALEKVNSHLGLAFDDYDLTYYTELFVDKLRRNPTSVECFDLAQSNSEHSRHWFFKGQLVIDGVTQPESLLQMVIGTQFYTNQNNVIKFSDNSSAIEGYPVENFRPEKPWKSSLFQKSSGKKHIIFTAETHNFPTGVSPFSGAATGTGGRIRDVQAVGRGGHVVAGTAGYCFGNLLIPGYKLPWEDSTLSYPANFASPLEIAIRASDGASHYGNKFGEPVIGGFARSFGMIIDGETAERREWIKPIMFSGGIGTMEANMVSKCEPEKGMKVVKVGGPVYRIGVGGGSASSVEVQGDNESELDFGAVQRGDAEMEQKLNRLIRSCIEMGEDNPICSIHDQGAGGNGNVLKELVEPAGAIVYTKKFILGDPTINTLELWGAEYQESNALLCQPGDATKLETIARRERCPVSFVGTVTGDKKIVLSEETVPDLDDVRVPEMTENGMSGTSYPVELDLDLVLGKMPKKTFNLSRKTLQLKPVSFPPDVTIADALEHVLRLPSVSSKRYLTNKVDRSVTGLVAQQQCVGPLHTPLADVAVTALSYFDTVGAATAIGEQPIKGLVNVAAGARMAVAEALTNLVFARITCLKDVKCSANWMWPAKLPGEGAALHDACESMCAVMKQLGIAVDGGKDSLSMAARVNEEIVKAPGTLVVSAYAPCPDICSTVTPDLKCPSLGEEGVLLLVDLSGGKSRLGGTALAQCYGQLGDETPDLDNPVILQKAFNVIQRFLQDGKVCAGHDISDGGLITCILEMAFGGNCGMLVDIPHKTCSPLEVLFTEELGWVLEVHDKDVETIMFAFHMACVPCIRIGQSRGYGPDAKIDVIVNGSHELEGKMLTILMQWEDTSYQLERLQANPACAEQENKSYAQRTKPKFHLSFDPEVFNEEIPQTVSGRVPCVAVVREEGTNGDREMAAALFTAGFEVWDVMMEDLITEEVKLSHFQGLVFPGGFSYGDVLGSAKGWAASMFFHPSLQQQIEQFYQRNDTFSLGVCNGCQLLALLGWIGEKSDGIPSESPSESPVFSKQNIFLDHNLSERFESRFCTVRIEKSNSIMMSGLEGSVFGVWVAHSEGRFTFRNDAVYSDLEAGNCVVLHYVDDEGNPTEMYPQNPNGSQGGLAGVCSADGRHLAMMPHPERCVQLWQWAWMPPEWQKNLTTSPWCRMFQNAYSWCLKNNSS